MLRWFLNLFIDTKYSNNPTTRHIATIYDSVRISGEYKPSTYFSFILLECCGVRKFKYVGRKYRARKYGLYKHSKVYTTIVVPWMFGDYNPLINFAKKNDMPIPADYIQHVPRYDMSSKMIVTGRIPDQPDPSIKALGEYHEH